MDVSEKNMKQKFNIQHFNIIIIHVRPTTVLLVQTKLTLQ